MVILDGTRVLENRGRFRKRRDYIMNAVGVIMVGKTEYRIESDGVGFTGDTPENIRISGDFEW